MASSAELLRMVGFVSKHRKLGLFSTNATVVDVLGVVYNVKGSTHDPKIGGKSWKQLLISYGIDHDCYVTNQNPPTGTSHSNFSVGGHVTDNSGGIVADGDITYLMPLCYWHNSTKRDGKKFTHTEIKMLELEGFMQGDTSATFMARLSDKSKMTSRIIFETEVGWDYKPMLVSEKKDIKAQRKFRLYDDTYSTPYFVITKNPEDGKYYFDFASEEFDIIK